MNNNKSIFFYEDKKNSGLGISETLGDLYKKYINFSPSQLKKIAAGIGIAAFVAQALLKKKAEPTPFNFNEFNFAGSGGTPLEKYGLKNLNENATKEQINTTYEKLKNMGEKALLEIASKSFGIISLIATIVLQKKIYDFLNVPIGPASFNLRGGYNFFKSKELPREENNEDENIKNKNPELYKTLSKYPENKLLTLLKSALIGGFFTTVAIILLILKHKKKNNMIIENLPQYEQYAVSAAGSNKGGYDFYLSKYRNDKPITKEDEIKITDKLKTFDKEKLKKYISYALRVASSLGLALLAFKIYRQRFREAYAHPEIPENEYDILHEQMRENPPMFNDEIIPEMKEEEMKEDDVWPSAAQQEELWPILGKKYEDKPMFRRRIMKLPKKAQGGYNFYLNKYKDDQPITKEDKIKITDKLKTFDKEKLKKYIKYALGIVGSLGLALLAFKIYKKRFGEAPGLIQLNREDLERRYGVNEDPYPIDEMPLDIERERARILQILGNDEDLP